MWWEENSELLSSACAAEKHVTGSWRAKNAHSGGAPSAAGPLIFGQWAILQAAGRRGKLSMSPTHRRTAPPLLFLTCRDRKERRMIGEVHVLTCLRLYYEKHCRRLNRRAAVALNGTLIEYLMLRSDEQPFPRDSKKSYFGPLITPADVTSLWGGLFHGLNTSNTVMRGNQSELTHSNGALWKTP